VRSPEQVTGPAFSDNPSSHIAMTISTLQSLSVSTSGSHSRNSLQAYRNSNGDSREPCRLNPHTSYHTTSGMSDILEVVDNFNAMVSRSFNVFVKSQNNRHFNSPSEIHLMVKQT
jgi:hypothetical protein